MNFYFSTLEEVKKAFPIKDPIMGYAYEAKHNRWFPYIIDQMYMMKPTETYLKQSGYWEQAETSGIVVKCNKDCENCPFICELTNS